MKLKVKLLKENKVGWSIDGVLHDIDTEFEINPKTYESAKEAGIKLSLNEINDIQDTKPRGSKSTVKEHTDSEI